MGRYRYTFTLLGKEITATGYNLYNGAENAGFRILRADRLSRYYLQDTPFDERERKIWALPFDKTTIGSIGNLYTVTQTRI